MPLLSLEYPNGRHTEVEHPDAERLEVGQVFQLYGRGWRVISHGKSGGPRHQRTEAIVCRAVTASALSLPDVHP